MKTTSFTTGNEAIYVGYDNRYFSKRCKVLEVDKGDTDLPYFVAFDSKYGLELPKKWVGLNDLKPIKFSISRTHIKDTFDGIDRRIEIDRRTGYFTNDNNRDLVSGYLSGICAAFLAVSSNWPEVARMIDEEIENRPNWALND